MEDTPLSPVLLRFPLVDQATGLVTRPWQQWFLASWYRQGGANAPPNDALGGELGVLQGALEETQAALAATQAALAQTQAELDATQAQLAATQAELAATQAELEATQDEIDALLPDGTPLAVARYQADGSGVEAAPLTVDAQGNAILGTATPGGGAQRALVLESGVAPSGSHPADAVQLWVEDLAADNAALLLRPEGGQTYTFGGIALQIGSRLLPISVATVTQMVLENPTGAAALQLSATGAGGGALNVVATGGTAATPSATLAEETLFAVNVRGHTGAAVTGTTAQIRFRSEQAFSSGRGSYLQFFTARLGVTNPTEKLRLTALGNVRVSRGIVSPVEGTNAEGVLVLATGVAPTAAHPADAVQIWAADRGATAGKSSLHVRAEDGTSHVLGDLSGIGTLTPTAPLDVAGDTLRLRTARTPASATAAGNAGDVCWDSGFIYVAVAANSWKRAALTTW